MQTKPVAWRIGNPVFLPKACPHTVLPRVLLGKSQQHYFYALEAYLVIA